MISSIEENEDFISDLKDLLRLNYAIIEAYEISIKKIKNEEYKNKLEEFKADHFSHIKVISTFLNKHGYETPTSSGVEKFLIQGRAILKDLVDDISILKAMKSNEQDANRASQNINNYQTIYSHFRKSLLGKYEDEKKHLSWFEEEL